MIAVFVANSCPVLTLHLVLAGLRYRVVLASGEVCSSLGPAGARVCCRCGPHVHEGLWVACEVRRHRHHFVDIDISIFADTVINDGSSKNVFIPLSEGNQLSRSNLWPREPMPCPWYVRQVTRLFMPNLELRKGRRWQLSTQEMPWGVIYHAGQPSVVSRLWLRGRT